MANPQPSNNPNNIFQSSEFQTHPPKSSKKVKILTIALVFTSLFAIAGIAFGIYGILTSQQKSAEITSLNATISSRVAELSASQQDSESSHNQSSNTYQNPIIPSSNASDNPYSYVIRIQSYYTQFPNISLTIKEGDLTTCTIQNSANDQPTDCVINGISGKISKAFSLQNVDFGFILQDGTVQTFKLPTDNTSNQFTVQTLPIDGFVTDAVVTASDNDMYWGLADIFFVLRDGSLVSYREATNIW